MSALKFAFSLVSVLLLVQTGSGSGHWGYGEDNGPATWEGACADGKKQSPIDIVPAKAKIVQHPDAILSDSYYEPTGLEAVANGHSVEIRPLSGPHKLSLSHRGNMYTMSQIHFHWGCSEHTYNGECYDMEMHCVHVNDNCDPEMDSTCLTHLVVGAFLKESDLVDMKRERALSDALNAASKSKDHEFVPMENEHKLSTFMPSCSGTYTNYNGSLTTPGCSEVVEWLNYLEPIPVSAELIERFKQVKGSDGEPLTYNYRPTQPLNGRKVYLRPGNENEVNGANPGRPKPVFPPHLLSLWSAFYSAYKSRMG